MAHKRCPRCCEDLDRSAFGANVRNRDGLATYCRSGWRMIHAERRRSLRQAAGKPEPVRREAPSGSKWCPDCEAVLPLDAFSKNRANRNGLHTYCRGCAGRRIKESAQRLHGGHRNYHLVRRFGVSAAEVDAMMARQARICPICLDELGEKPHVDHDHRTGAIRGILCFNCNAGLGKYGDDPQRLLRAAGYLERLLPAPTRWPGVDVVVESLDWMPEHSTAQMQRMPEQ